LAHNHSQNRARNAKRRPAQAASQHLNLAKARLAQSAKLLTPHATAHVDRERRLRA